MSAKARVLARLRNGPATTAQLCQPDIGGVRFGARLLELRIEGHEITERRLRAGSSLYTLVAGPTARTPGDKPSVPSRHDGAGHENPLVAVAADDTAPAGAGHAGGIGDMRPVVGRGGGPWRRAYMCRHCRYREIATPRCGCGRQAVKGWSADFTRPVQADMTIVA